MNVSNLKDEALFDKNINHLFLIFVIQLNIGKAKF